MIEIKFLLCLSTLLVTEAAINICIPPSSDATAESNYDILKAISNDIFTIFSNDSKLDIGHVDLNIDHPAIRLVGPLDDVVIYNLDDFTLCFLENIFVNSSYYQFDLFNLTFTNFRIEGIYNLTGDLGDFFDLYGDGNFWMEFKDFSIAVVNFTFIVGDEICFPFNLEIDLQAIDNHLYNFMYDDELEVLFNDVITAIVPESVRIVWEELKEDFEKSLEYLINETLHRRKISLENLINEVKSGEKETGKYCYKSK